MKHYLKIIVFVVAIMYIGGFTAFAEEYRMEPGDVLSIGVWGFVEFQTKNPVMGVEGSKELQAQGLMVRPDGKLAFPLVGEVQASGLTPSELTQNLTAGLSEYLVDPKLIVNIVKFHTTRVYVLGQVYKPGMYEIEKQHNLLDAIGMAGGYTKDAAKKKVIIISKDNKGKPRTANLLALLTKGDISQNYCLSDGDTVYLSDNGRIDFARDILPWISAAYQVNNLEK